MKANAKDRGPYQKGNYNMTNYTKADLEDAEAELAYWIRLSDENSDDPDKYKVFMHAASATLHEIKSAIKEGNADPTRGR